jgi:multidrug transporter EmrE-like cation transporter
MIWLVISAIFFAVGEFLSKKFALSPKFSLVVLVAVVDVISTLFWLPAMLHKNMLSVTGTMWSILSLITTVLIGLLVFGEKLSFIDTLGLITAFISIILLSIG